MASPDFDFEDYHNAVLVYVVLSISYNSVSTCVIYCQTDPLFSVSVESLSLCPESFLTRDQQFRSCFSLSLFLFFSFLLTAQHDYIWLRELGPLLRVWLTSLMGSGPVFPLCAFAPRVECKSSLAPAGNLSAYFN